MSTILTAAGESLIARLQAEGKALVIDTMILANVPGQDHTQPIAPGVSVPEESQIALRYAIPPQYRAYVNPNQVVYSAMLGSDMGDFFFNWQGLWCSEHNTLVAVATFPALEKRRYDEANGKTGNNLTRNFLLTFTGARELTGLTISADVWQLDFTVRLNGIDERQRLANFDIYGQAFFDGQGWLLQKTAEAYAFVPGLGYVGGIRAALAESLPLAAPESANLPQNVWLDVCLKPTGSDRVAEASPMLTAPTAPLTDSAADETGLMHYRALVARIEADGSVTDLRPRKTSGALPIPDVATPEVAGTMRPDGVTCHMDEDLLKVFLARSDRAGLVLPDGVTTKVADGGIFSARLSLASVQSYYAAGVYNWTVPDINGDGSPWLGWIRIKGSGEGGGAAYLSGVRCGGDGGDEGTTVMRHVRFVPGEVHILTVGAGGAAVSGGAVTNGNSTSFGSITFAPGGGSTKAPISDEIMIPGAKGGVGQANANDSNLSQSQGATGGGAGGGDPNGGNGKYGGGGGGGIFQFQKTTPSLGGKGGDGFIEIFRMI